MKMLSYKKRIKEENIGDWFTEWNKDNEKVDSLMYLSWACFILKKVNKEFDESVGELKKRIEQNAYYSPDLDDENKKSSSIIDLWEVLDLIDEVFGTK